jgi:chromosome segregation ATPase
MNNEKYINAYVEVLTGVMQDAIIKNVSFQANANISEDIIKEQSEQIAKLQVMVANINQNNDEENSKNEKTIESLNQTINDLNQQIQNLNNVKNDYENIKHQVNHVDTFRIELIKEREKHQKTRNDYENIIKELNEKIDYLQLTPAKRKKIDDAKNVKVETKIIDLFREANSIIKDGGSF